MKNNTFHSDCLWHSMEERLAWIGSSVKSHWIPVVGILALLIAAAVFLLPTVIRDSSQSEVSQSAPLTQADIARVSELFKIQQPNSSVPYYLREPMKPTPVLKNAN